MRFLFSILLVLIVSCSANTQEAADFELKSYEQFSKLSSEPLYQKYGQVQSLKIVLDNSTEKLHFISSERYDYHYEYCMAELNYPYDLARFNDESYTAATDRRFLIANINYYKALNKYALELGPSDRMNLQHLIKLFEAVKKEVFFGDELLLMVNTVHVNELTKNTKQLPLITPEEIYKGQVYQPISKKKAEGRIVIISDWKKQRDTIKPYDILLLKEIPMEFPLVAGVVVTEFQTPLSHVSLLGQNRRIPICAYSKLWESEKWSTLNGKTVSYEVQQDTFFIVQKEVDLKVLEQKGKPIRLKMDVTVDSIIPITYIKERHASIVGNKAANFGELNNYSTKVGFKTPESAFAIPFYFYKQHESKSGASLLISQLCEKENLERSRIEIEADLKKIRNLLKNLPVDTQLKNDVKRMIFRLGDYRRMRFRSSTNAEDSEGFSGAGLYQSKTVDLNSEDKTIEKGIMSVWTSLWSYEAFMEREAFNLDHEHVAMGILVHRSFPDEEVNGVAITTNLYRKNYLGFVVNAQLGDESVVQPRSGVQCDQFICYPDETVTEYGKDEAGIDVITTSSLYNGQLVMTQKEIQHLANTLELIKRQYLRRHYIRTSYFDFGLDIEFKLDGQTRELYIKQMRVYNH